VRGLYTILATLLLQTRAKDGDDDDDDDERQWHVPTHPPSRAPGVR